MFALLDMSSSEEEEEEEEEDSPNIIDISIKEINLRSAIFDMSDYKFQTNFGVSKKIFLYILDEISPHLNETHRMTAISKENKLATTLRFLATGGYQKKIGSELMTSLSQSKVSEAINECLSVMEQSLCPKWIKFNFSPEEEMDIKVQFLEKFGIPGVIGCVGGTHVKIMPPKKDVKHLYYNRKGFCSLNVMLICDSKLIITYVDSSHPGADHDSFIWSSSEADGYLKNSYLNGKSNTWLLGDGGYQCLPYLLTPYRNPSTESQIIFNTMVTKARSSIERCIGVLKNRFRCLLGERDLHYKQEKAKMMVNVCCALHNICIFYKHEWPPMDESVAESENADILENDISITSAAQSIRDGVANNLI